MARKTLDRNIQTITEDLLILGSMVEQALLGSVSALKDHDMEKSLFVREGDARINFKRYDLEGQIITTMATQSPLIHDLRFLAAAMNISTELERIGDYAKAIANANLRSKGISMPELLLMAHKMGLTVADMLHRSMTAFIENDAEKARKIILEDDIVDGMYNQMYYACMERVIHDARTIERINYMLWVAHSLERSADRATNICERAIYVKTASFNHEQIRYS